MRMYDLIYKKRNGGMLTGEEIQFFVSGITSGEIPDYQASALLMAIYFQGMDEQETATLTLEMAKSGDMVDLSAIPGIKVDKHSTGGVGDKTSLIVGPIVAACGVPVAKMSGRGLGHTGGTVDKMESIPGLNTAIAEETFFAIVRDTGLSIIGQSGNIAPADKKLYALRDVTATVDSIPLIASSIMSKKLAAGSDAILLDVKTGSGAFMKTLEDSIKLAKAMVAIGENNGRRTMALITDMDTPLGNAIGNSLEIAEVVEVLHGNGPADLLAVSLELAANMLVLADKGDLVSCREMAREAITSGLAFAKLKAMVAAQGGSVSVLEDTGKLTVAPLTGEFCAETDGIINKIDTEACGIASVALGAGRARKDEDIDHSAGIILRKKIGETVKKGDAIATLYARNEQQLSEAKRILQQAVMIRDTAPVPGKSIYARVTRDRIECF